MRQTVDFLLRHGYAVLFLTVLAEQGGLPLPAVPALLAMGALIALGNFSPWVALPLAVLASVLSDLLWYELGRYRGQDILGLLCRVSLEPDYCINRTKNVFGRYGDKGLLLAKFLPGLSTIAPPLSGMTRMKRTRFLLLDGIGAALWAGLFMGFGALFHTQLEYLADTILRLGSYLVFAVAGLLALYGAWQIYQRRRILRELRLARVTPEEVKQWLDANVPLAIVDLRHNYDVRSHPCQLPGAIRLTIDDLESRHEEIPRDREVVLYCS